MLGKALDCIECGLTQTGFVGAASRCGDQVDVGFARQTAFGRPADGPRRTGARREVFVAGCSVFFGIENRCNEFAVDLFGQILLHAVGKAPRRRCAVFNCQRDLQAGQQHGLAAQQAFEFSLRDRRRIEKTWVGPGAHQCAGCLLRRIADPAQGLNDLAARKHDLMARTVAHHLYFQPRRQRIGHRHANAMQAAREAIRRGAVAFVEFAAGVQLRKHDFDRRHFLNRMHLDRDATPVVLDSYRAIAMQHHPDALAITAQRFIGGVVDGLLNDVQGAIRARVHARTVANGFQSFEDGNGFCGVTHRTDFSSGRASGALPDTRKASVFLAF